MLSSLKLEMEALILFSGKLSNQTIPSLLSTIDLASGLLVHSESLRLISEREIHELDPTDTLQECADTLTLCGCLSDMWGQHRRVSEGESWHPCQLIFLLAFMWTPLRDCFAFSRKFITNF